MSPENKYRYQKNWRSWPLIRHLRALQFRRLKPFGNGRSDNLSVIRYYWYSYLGQHRADIRGHGLEIGNTETIRFYGGENLTQADAVDLTESGPDVRVVADLSRADHVAGDQYDCFVNQFTTSVIYDVEAMLYHSIRLLKPGGVLLLNFWCMDFYLYRGLVMESGLPLYMYWWFTPIQVVNLIGRMGIAEDDYKVEVFGNLFTRMAFLMNLDARELTRKELDFKDPGQPLLICVRIVKPSGWQCEKPVYQTAEWKPNYMPAHASADTGHYGDIYK
ncbi:MAG: class I SAM-dependent methyltransferase [Candidatus Promineifilaceae bacterium]